MPVLLVNGSLKAIGQSLLGLTVLDAKHDGCQLTVKQATVQRKIEFCNLGDRLLAQTQSCLKISLFDSDICLIEDRRHDIST